MTTRKPAKSEAMKEWSKGRDNHSGVLLRRVTLELEGEESPRIIEAFRIWERDTKTGLQLTNWQKGYPEKWQWFPNDRIISITVVPMEALTNDAGEEHTQP